METKVGFIVTGGPVSVPTLNTLLRQAANATRRNGGIPIGFSGGFYPMLSQRRIPPFEITDDKCNPKKSLLITERVLPRRSQEDWTEIERQIVDVYGVTRLIVIGGNGTASTLGQIQRFCPKIKTVVQIPKTMDGDFITPDECLGFTSAVATAAEEISVFSLESTLIGSPYLVRFLGRDTGEFAFRAAVQAEASLILIPEEFRDAKVTLTSEELVDMIVACQLKLLAKTSEFGIVAFSEGIIDCLDFESQKKLGCKFKDGNNIDRIDFSKSRFEDYLVDLMIQRFNELNVRAPSGNFLERACRSIGYYSRAAKPVVSDLLMANSYAERAVTLAMSEQDTGFSVLGPNGVLKLEDLLLEDGEVEQCWVDTRSPEFKAQRELQYRINPSDFSTNNLEKIAEATNLTAQQMKEFLMPVKKLFQRLSA